MDMTFWFGSNINNFLFKGLGIHSAGSMVLLCLIMMGFAIFYESFKVYDAKTRARAARERTRAASSTPQSETATLLATETSPIRKPFIEQFWKATAAVAIFLLHNSLGYGLMLVVMLYNGYMFIAIVFGMGLGYFIFGHISMKINMENVQARRTAVICSPKCKDSGRSN